MIGYKFAALLVVALFLGDCDSKIVVDQVKPGDEVPANGMIYALPNTVVRLQLKIDKTTKQPARFAHYAGIFAPDGKPVCADEHCNDDHITTYALQDGATFSTYGEPDPGNVFLVKFVGGGAIDQSLTMNWNEVGILNASSATVSNRTGDIALSLLKMAAGLAAKTSSARMLTTARGAEVCEIGSSTDDWVLKILKNASTSTDTLRANYCTIDHEMRDKWTHDEQLLQEALDAYLTRVEPLIQSRTNILKGNSASEEPATLLSHIEDEINEQLIVLYLGRAKTVTWDGALDVRTIKESVPLPILGIDSTKGICIKPGAELAPTTKPIPWSVDSSENPGRFTQLTARACEAAPYINLTFSLYPDRDKQLFSKIKDIEDKERSFRYRVAAQVKATLADTENTYGTGLFSVSQLGKTIALKAAHHSKSLTYELTLIESTGALKTFKLGSVGILDTATIDALSGVTGTLLNATKKKSETDILNEQYQLLKLKDDICTIQKKYNLPCTVAPQ